ncbi:MAG TPA: FAD-binding oxidoreductase [Flavobacteriaceae bacterium]|nr:FAD-binding oxidoreductase [Flavobacteriaceae bacterium]
MKNQIVKITNIGHITHDVLHIMVEKPEGMKFTPGQATEVSINKTDWKEESRPFTFVNLPQNNYLEFMIKTYPEHKGVTNQLLSLEAGDELILNYVFGAIEYKGEGTFIAGGAGITPFVSILRNLKFKDKVRGNKLIFANKTKDDIIIEDELRGLLGKNFHNILSHDKAEGYAHGYVTDAFLKKHHVPFNKYIYLCGPPPMMKAIENILDQENFDKSLLIKEEF